MKTTLLSIVFTLTVAIATAQPCKTVKIGMTKAEVLKAAGKPMEIDSIGSNINIDGSKSREMVWQYGKPENDGNQRVEFTGDKVHDVIADGKKFDELMEAFQRGDFPKKEIYERIEKLNKEACK